MNPKQHGMEKHFFMGSGLSQTITTQSYTLAPPQVQVGQRGYGLEEVLARVFDFHWDQKHEILQNPIEIRAQENGSPVFYLFFMNVNVLVKL